MNIIKKTTIDMRKIITVILICISTCLLISCDSVDKSDNDTSGSTPVTKVDLDNLKKELTGKIKNLSDSINNTTVTQDTINGALNANINDLQNKLNNLNDSIKSLNEKITSINKSNESKQPQNGLSTVLSWCSLVIAIIALALVWSFPKRFYKDKLRYILHKDFDKSNQKIQEINEKLNLLAKKQTTTNQNNKQYEELERRIKALEVANNRGNSSISRNIANTSSNRETVHQEVNTQKVVYAKLNSGKYFLELSESNQEGCVFKINYNTSLNRGEFCIISLDKIKSRNGWNEVVDYSGNCVMKEATDYRLVEKGLCEKLTDGTWEVKRKLKITITK